MRKLWTYFKRLILVVFSFIGIYFLCAFLFGAVTVNNDSSDNYPKTHFIYLATNGVHMDIVLPIDAISDSLKLDLFTVSSDRFFAFGWGDEGFYLKTPTWSELKLSTAVNAAFLDGPTLMHVARYSGIQSKWIKIPVSSIQLQKINSYIQSSFDISNGKKTIIPGASYGRNDNFYKAIGSYHCFKTCNTWVNSCFKQSGLKACFWTPFDSPLLDKYH